MNRSMQAKTARDWTYRIECCTAGRTDLDNREIGYIAHSTDCSAISSQAVPWGNEVGVTIVRVQGPKETSEEGSSPRVPSAGQKARLSRLHCSYVEQRRDGVAGNL